MKLRKGVVITQTDEGTFLLDTRNGSYWHLNSTGIEVLESLVRGEPLDTVVDRIAVVGKVDRAVVAGDCADLVRDLRAARLLRGSR